MKLVSVIMPVTLRNYPGCSKDRKKKFYRAINSFLNQDYEKKELIIVSDGCNESEKIIHSDFSDYKNIKIYRIPRQVNFSGKVRQTGLYKATGEIICYLDSDDELMTDHLSFIVKPENWGGYYQWCFFNDYVKISVDKLQKRTVLPCFGHIGTSGFAHLRAINFHWESGYNHDWFSIEKCLLNKPGHHIGQGGYIVCHIDALKIDF